MQGSIRRRGDSWRIRVDAGVDPVTKKRRQVSRTVRGTKKEAQEALRALIAEVGAGPQGTDRTVSFLLERWLAHAGPEYSAKTLEDYQGLIRRTVAPELGDRPLRQLGPAELDGLYGRMRDAGAAAGTIRKVHYLLRRALHQAVRWGWIPANPAERADPPRPAATDLKVPSPQEVRQLIDRARSSGDEQMATLITLAAVTGARRGELCGLRWSDFAFVEDLPSFELMLLKADGRQAPAAVVTIARSVVAVSGRLVVKETKTRRVRRLAVDADTAALLRQQRERATEAADACGISHHPGAYVFPPDPTAAAPLRPDSISHRFARLCAGAGVDGVRFHDLRHWAATHMLANGVDIRTTMGRLGHSQMATTQGYAHFVEAADQEAAEVLRRLLG